MRAARFARDAQPEQAPREVVEPHEPRQPAGFEELGCPDEIELRLPGATEEWDIWLVKNQLDVGGCAPDQVYELGTATAVFVTKQAEDCWYAGVPRGRRLVLRRI